MKTSTLSENFFLFFSLLKALLKAHSLIFLLENLISWIFNIHPNVWNVPYLRNRSLLIQVFYRAFFFKFSENRSRPSEFLATIQRKKKRTREVSVLMMILIHKLLCCAVLLSNLIIRFRVTRFQHYMLLEKVFQRW